MEEHPAIKALREINKLIYSVGAPLGSDVYFKIRVLCTDNLPENQNHGTGKK